MPISELDISEMDISEMAIADMDLADLDLDGLGLTDTEDTETASAADDSTPASPRGIQVVHPPMPANRSDGMIPVRVDPLVRFTGTGFADDDEAPSEAFVDQELIVDYTGALARRAAGHIRDGLVSRVDNRHPHPAGVSCLRCAVLGATDHAALGVTLLEILTRTNADECWNNSEACTDTKLVSRLRRLAISAASMEDIYGPRWGAVMLTCLRIERTEFELLDYLTRRFKSPRVLGIHTRESLAAYHLAMTSTTRKLRDGGPLTEVKRNAVSVRMAVAVGSLAAGYSPELLDHLPAPAL